MSENNKNIKKGCELEIKCIDFIKTLDIKRPYPSNKMHLEDLLNYSSKITGCIMGLLMVFLLVPLFIQRMNAEKVIKKSLKVYLRINAEQYRR